MKKIQNSYSKKYTVLMIAILTMFGSTIIPSSRYKGVKYFCLENGGFVNPSILPSIWVRFGGYYSKPITHPGIGKFSEPCKLCKPEKAVEVLGDLLLEKSQNGTVSIQKPGRLPTRDIICEGKNDWEKYARCLADKANKKINSAGCYGKEKFLRDGTANECKEHITNSIYEAVKLYSKLWVKRN